MMGGGGLVGDRVGDRAGDRVNDDDVDFMDEFLPLSLAADIIAATKGGNSTDDYFLPPIHPLPPLPPLPPPQ
jgi:hypothetical protein